MSEQYCLFDDEREERNPPVTARSKDAPRQPPLGKGAREMGDRKGEAKRGLPYENPAVDPAKNGTPAVCGGNETPHPPLRGTFPSRGRREAPSADPAEHGTPAVCGGRNTPRTPPPKGEARTAWRRPAPGMRFLKIGLADRTSIIIETELSMFELSNELRSKAKVKLTLADGRSVEVKSLDVAYLENVYCAMV